MSEEPAPLLKELFDAARFHAVADLVRDIRPDFDRKRFLRLALEDLDGLALLGRMRRMSESLHAVLPGGYRRNLGILRKLAPRIGHRFVSMVLPDYVGRYGLRDVAVSLEALRYFTGFGSSEFAIREFLRQDLSGTLAVMETWSRDRNEEVRRLASEGCRPRLPWSFRLEPLIADPSPAAAILENLRNDPSLYVRKSVANHLNDISRDHPEWVLDRLEQWPRDQPHTAWIVRHALRTLIKQGDARALERIGATRNPQVEVREFSVVPAVVRLGEAVTLTLKLKSEARTVQQLVADYRIHYVRQSGATSGKVFKWKVLALAEGGEVTLTHRRLMRNFSTRRHYPGRHTVEVMLNGRVAGMADFDLVD